MLYEAIKKHCPDYFSEIKKNVIDHYETTLCVMDCNVVAYQVYDDDDSFTGIKFLFHASGGRQRFALECKAYLKDGEKVFKLEKHLYGPVYKDVYESSSITHCLEYIIKILEL